MAQARTFLGAGVGMAGLAVIVAACAAPGRGGAAIPVSPGQSVPRHASPGPASGLGSASGRPVAEGAAGILLTPGGVAWTSVSDSVLRSTDSGITWRKVLPAKAGCACLGPAYFLGPSRAWDIRERSIPGTSEFAARVWLTTNGGRAWTIGGNLPGEPSLNDADPFKQIYFADATHGWILGYGDQFGAPGAASRLEVVLWRTQNGGRSWQRADLTRMPEAGRPVRDVGGADGCGAQDSLGLTFTDATTGWLTGNGCAGTDPQAWISHDGGSRWQPVSIPPPAGGWQPGATAHTEAPVFITTHYGLLPVSTGPGRLLIYRTLDAGRHWALASSVATGSLERPAGLIALTSARWVLPAADGLLATSSAGRRWRLVGSGTDLQDLSPLAMRADGTGLAEGAAFTSATYPFAAYRTADAGRTWSPVGRSPAVAGLRTSLVDGVHMTSRTRGFGYGLAGIEETSDGGHAWTTAARSVGAITGLAFGGHRNGIAVAADSLLVTSDGGRHWRPGAEPAAGPLAWVQMESASAGFGAVCGTQGASAFERTADGGRTWEQVSLPGAPAGSGSAAAGSAGSGSAGGISPGACGGIQGTAVCFASPRAGFYVAAASGRRPVLYRTADSGRSWLAIGHQVPPGIDGLSACRGSALWAVVLQQTMSGSLYAIFRSGNGGRTWKEVLATAGAQDTRPGSTGRPAAVTGGPGPFLAALDVTGPQTAWVVGGCESCGRDGQLAVTRTDDGGRAWTAPAGTPAAQRDPVPVLAMLSAAYFRSASAGWLLGWPTGRGNGPTVLLATGDGGVSWRQIAVFPGP